MIFDSISRLSLYKDVLPGVRAVLDYLKRTDPATIPAGKHPIGGGVSVAVNRYEPKPESPFEAHKNYIDLQYMVAGSEDIIAAPAEALKNPGEYQTEKDILFADCADRVTKLTLHDGDFALLYPTDAHAPGRKNADTAGEVHKLVFKIPTPEYEMRSHLTQLMDVIGFPKQAVTDVLGAEERITESGRFPALEADYFAEKDISDALVTLAGELSLTDSLCRLTVLLMLAKTTFYRYLENGISPEVYFESMSDFAVWERACERKNGYPGLMDIGWLTQTLLQKLYRLGRLQFQPSHYYATPYVCGSIPLTPGMPVIHIHIPEGSSLTKEARLDAYKKAQKFFADRFEGGRVIFACDSWLLYPAHRQFLRPDSNVLGFMDDFTIVSGRENLHDDHNLWRIFGYLDDYNDYDALPQTTGMQKAYVTHLRETGCTGGGYGVFTYDGVTFEK